MEGSISVSKSKSLLHSAADLLCIVVLAYPFYRSVFDINNLSLIGTIASHLSYWDDEDCAHFMISQLLSRQRIIKR